MSRQVSHQHRVAQLQPQHDGFFPPKYQKTRLEILGSLVFWVGLALTKPAWSTSPVGTAALPVSNTNPKEPIGFTAPSKEVDDIPAHPEVLPPDVTGDTLKEWAQPLLGKRGSWGVGEQSQSFSEDRGAGEQRSRAGALVRTGEPGSEEAEKKSATFDGNLVSASPPSLISTSEPEGEREKSPTQAEDGEQAFTLGLSPLDLSPSLPVTPSCSLTQELRLTPEQKLPCNSTPSLVADAENAPNVEVEVQQSPSENSSESQQPGSSEDPELGKLRLRELAENAPNFEVEVQQSPNENSSESQQPGSGEDPELGKLRLRELPAPPPPSKPAVYLLGGVGYFRSNNILSGIDPIDDDVFRAGLTLLATPSLGPQTNLLAAVGGNINRYGELSVYDYDELNFNLGIRQKLGSRIYGEVGWSNRQLFSQNSGDRFLNDHSLYLELGRRDVLAKQVTLDTFYQLRVSLANPSDRSQVINYVGASLGYTPIPPLEVALDYQFAFADFTQQERTDQYHQLLARMSYTLTPNSRAYLYAGPSFGGSSKPDIDFNGFVFGAGVNFNLTLF